MNILPSKHDRISNLSRQEKKLIKSLGKVINDNGYFLVSINPAGVDGVHALICEKGISFIDVLSLQKDVIKGNEEAFEKVIELKTEKIYKRLCQHKKLKTIYNYGQKLNIPFTYKYFLTDVSHNDIKKYNNKDFYLRNCIFKDYSSHRLITNLFSHIIISYKNDWDGFSEEEINFVMQMISPEYTIPRLDKETITKEERNSYFSNDEEYTLTEDDFNVSVFRLDDEQVNIVNDIRKGNQLILACAGSGKSVILLSKAFKIANIENEKDFLLTCYNRNLAKFYNWKIAVAGFRERNVRCMTFHKLLQRLLKEAGVSYNSSEHNENFKKARRLLDKGIIKKRFHGIFIDEIQIFKPEWYEFCFDLIDNHSDDNYFFIICGDISQNINRNIKQGKAPWQGNPRLPNYRGRSLRIKKNYRNSLEINEFIENYAEVSKKYFKSFKIELDNEADIFLLGSAFRKSNPPRLIMSDRMKVIEEIIKEIKRLHNEENINLSDIGVLFPYRAYKPYKYHFLYWLRTKLDKEYIDYTLLISSKDKYGRNYGERVGVSLMTIDASLGLDFHAVILSGLLPMGGYQNSKNERILKSDSCDEDIKQDFIENVNKIYTACTRARDYLTVILEETEEKSIYSKIIKDSFRG
ncbi:MAG: DEAD/DEAH box helicase [bacterium]